MKPKTMLFLIILFCGTITALASQPGAPANEGEKLNAVMRAIEQRYAGAGFTVRFFQTSTIKAMDITDTADGRMWVQRPEKMRWEYASPTRQVIVTNGKDLWIYRPDDNQVMIGKAPAFFGGGKGAGFLSDMSRIREDFEASLVPAERTGTHQIKLVPRESGYNVEAVYLTVSDGTHEITHLKTLTAYGDETRFALTDYRFDPALSPDMFAFQIPEGAEVLTLDE